MKRSAFCFVKSLLLLSPSPGGRRLSFSSFFFVFLLSFPFSLCKTCNVCVSTGKVAWERPARGHKTYKKKFCYSRGGPMVCTPQIAREGRIRVEIVYKIQRVEPERTAICVSRFARDQPLILIDPRQYLRLNTYRGIPGTGTRESRK